MMVAHPEDPLAQVKHRTSSDVVRQGQPFFLIDWSAEAKHWQANLLASSPLSVIEVPPQTAYELVCSGKGVALLTQTMVRQDIETGRLVEIDLQDMPRLQRESLLVHRTSALPLPTVVKEWLRFFREEARHYCFAETVRALLK